MELDNVICSVRTGDLAVLAREVLTRDKDLLAELRAAQLQLLAYSFVQRLAGLIIRRNNQRAPGARDVLLRDWGTDNAIS